MAEQTPRVNATTLQSFTGKTVRIIGKVTQLHGDTASIDARGTVQIHLERDSHLILNHAVEVIGKVNGDMTIKEFASTDFGTNIDMEAVDAVVQASHTFRPLFYDD